MGFEAIFSTGPNNPIAVNLETLVARTWTSAKLAAGMLAVRGAEELLPGSGLNTFEPETLHHMAAYAKAALGAASLGALIGFPGDVRH